MRDEATSGVMLERLIDASSEVEHVPHDDVVFHLQWPADKGIIIESLKYFGDCAQLSIEGKITELEELCDVNDAQKPCNIFIDLPFPFMSYDSTQSIVDRIFRETSLYGKELSETRRIYIFGNKLNSLADLASTCHEISDALLACRVYNRLVSLNDDSVSSTFYIKSDFLVKYQAGIEKDYVHSLSNAEVFISEIDKYSKSSAGDDVLMLLKSEVNNETRHVLPDERVRCFFEKLDLIVDNYMVSKTGYLAKFSSYNIRQTYLNRCSKLRDSLRSSLSSLKSELVVFLTMFFTLSEFSPQDGFSIVNILILIGLFFAAFLCAVLLFSDSMSIQTIRAQAKVVIDELEAMPDASSTAITCLASDFRATKQIATFCLGLFFVAQIALFIPFVIAFHSCAEMQEASDLALLAASFHMS